MGKCGGTCCVEVDECGCACCDEMDECACTCCVEIAKCCSICGDERDIVLFCILFTYVRVQYTKYSIHFSSTRLRTYVPQRVGLKWMSVGVRTCCVEVDECGCVCCIEMDECARTCCVEIAKCSSSCCDETDTVLYCVRVLLRIRTYCAVLYTFPAPSQRNPASALRQIVCRKKLDAVQRSAA